MRIVRDASVDASRLEQAGANAAIVTTTTAVMLRQQARDERLSSTEEVEVAGSVCGHQILLSPQCALSYRFVGSMSSTTQGQE